MEKNGRFQASLREVLSTAGFLRNWPIISTWPCLPGVRFLLIGIFCLFFFQPQASGQSCNEKIPFINDLTNFDNLSVSDNVTGLPCLSTLSNLSNIVDNDPDNNATLSFTGLTCEGTISVVDNDAADTYSAGTFAGFKVSSNGLLQTSISAEVTIETYNDGAFSESFDAVTSTVGVNSALIDPSGNIILGFVTSQPFDEVRIVYNSLVSVLFTAQIYHAVIEEFCAGPALECNVQTPMNNPTYPTIIDPAQTGITGIACVGCTVDDAENVISSNTNDFGTIELTATVGAFGSIAVKDVLTEYPVGTFAGFNISNPELVGVDLLSGITITTYRDGVEQENSTTGPSLVSAGSSLLNGPGTQLVGFIAGAPFDEVKIEIENLLGVTSTTEVYNAVFQTFCAGPALDCGVETYPTLPDYPLIINNERTGISGVACAGCSVDDPQNVIDNDQTNFAEVILTAGVAATGSVSVQDVITNYPAGTFAGFDINNPSLIGVDLSSAGLITTYLEGVEQESSDDGILLSIQINMGGRQIVGFETSMPFDEVQINLNNLTDVDVGTTEVYRLVLRGGSDAGFELPAITGDDGDGIEVSNTCPSPTVDLTALVNSPPAGATVVWFTNNDEPPTGTPYATPTMAEDGTYYAYFYDADEDCYSPPSNPVTVMNMFCDQDGDGNPDDEDPAPNDPCVGYIEDAEDASNPIWADTDCDGDGVTNVTERDTDGTDPYDPCSVNLASVSMNATSTGDCDGDGVTDADEINGTDGDFSTPGDNTDPNDPCSLNLSDVSMNATSTGDCDGDGVTNADEINGLDDDFSTPGDNTDPLDPCDYNPADVTLTPSMAWNNLDCDGDGNPNDPDPNPLEAVANDDNATVFFGQTSTVDILANDDFLPGANTSLAQVGGNAGGTISFDPNTGEVDYTPLMSEVGQTVTIEYEVCNTAEDPDVCATATVSLMVEGLCTINAAVWLEGAYDSGPGEMRTDLNDQGLLPGQDPTAMMGTETPVGQPYSGAPWNYNGAEGEDFDYTLVGDAKAGYDPDVVDWVLVSLRSDVDESSTLCRQAGLLYKDGTIVFPDGCNCALVDGQEVYIVIEHRNHLPVMSDGPVTVSGGGMVTYDFRTQQSFITFLGDGQTMLSAGVFGMFAGNGDQASASGARTDANASDEGIWTLFNGTGDAYTPADFDLNGDANANDESLWLNNTGKASDANFD